MWLADLLCWWHYLVRLCDFWNLADFPAVTVFASLFLLAFAVAAVPCCFCSPLLLLHSHAVAGVLFALILMEVNASCFFLWLVSLLYLKS